MRWAIAHASVEPRGGPRSGRWPRRADGVMSPTRARPPIPAGTAASLRRMPAAAADLPLIASGKVREMYDLGDRILMVATDRISTYDVVHPTPIPDKGAVLTGLSAFWFEQTGHIVANHFVSATDGVPDDVRGRAMVVRKLRDAARSSASCAATSPARAGRTTRRPARSPGSSCRPACASPSACRRRSSRRRRRPTIGHDEAIDFERAAELVGDRDLMARVRDVSIALYRFAAEPRARARGHPRRHEVRVRPRRRRRARRRRRGAARPTRRASGRPTATQPGQRPAELRQAVRPRLGGRHAAGTRRRRRRRSPTTSWPGTRERYVEAYERITGEPFDDWLARTAP